MLCGSGGLLHYGQGLCTGSDLVRANLRGGWSRVVDLSYGFSSGTVLVEAYTGEGVCFLLKLLVTAGQ